jgi:hypothetical protein
MTRNEKDYAFAGPKGSARLRDMFDGRHQRELYHFMFAAGAEGWTNAGCDGCSMFVDQSGHAAYFHARGVGKSVFPFNLGGHGGFHPRSLAEPANRRGSSQATFRSRGVRLFRHRFVSLRQVPPFRPSGFDPAFRSHCAARDASPCVVY